MDNMFCGSDEALISACSKGNERALAEIYDRHGRSAYALAYKVTRSAPHAEEAVQDAFLALWKGAGRFDGQRASVLGWLLTLVRRRAIDVVRREQVRAGVPLPAELAGDGDAPAVTAARVDVRAALAALPPAQREVLALAYFGGLTQAQVAERLDEPLGTVKTRTWTALARMRAAMGDA